MNPLVSSSISAPAGRVTVHLLETGHYVYLFFMHVAHECFYFPPDLHVRVPRHDANVVRWWVISSVLSTTSRFGFAPVRIDSLVVFLCGPLAPTLSMNKLLLPSISFLIFLRCDPFCSLLQVRKNKYSSDISDRDCRVCVQESGHIRQWSLAVHVENVVL